MSNPNDVGDQSVIVEPHKQHRIRDLAGALYRGMPASNPLNNAVGYYQDFSKGRLTLSYSGTLDFHEVEDPAATLPKGFRGQVLRHDDDTTWYVDDLDVRHWIPDGATSSCIHDRGSREIGHVPGYAVTTLVLGAPASCSAAN